MCRLAAFVALVLCVLSRPVTAETARTTISTLLVHALLPELGSLDGSLSALDRELIGIAAEARTGRIQAAEDRLRVIKSRAADARDQYTIRLFARAVERFRITCIGSSYACGGDLLVEGLRSWNESVEFTALSKSLSAIDMRDAAIADAYSNAIFLSLTNAPTWRRAQAMGFGSQEGNLGWIENVRRDATNRPDAAMFLSEQDRRRVDHLIDGVAAAAINEPDSALLHFQELLKDQNRSATFAILLRIGDAYAMPAGSILTASYDVANIAFLMDMYDGGLYPKFGVDLPEERRKSALEWYRCAAQFATSVSDERAIRFRLLMIDQESTEHIEKFEWLAEETDEDLVGWAALAVVALAGGRPSGMFDAISAALRQGHAGAAVSFALMSSIVSRSGLESETALPVLESAGRAVTGSSFDWIAADTMAVLARKYREMGRFSAAVVAARIGFERQSRFLEAYRTAVSALSPPAPAEKVSSDVADLETLRGRLLLEWRTSLAWMESRPSEEAQNVERAWSEYERTTLASLDAVRRRRVLFTGEMYPLTAQWVRFYRLFALGDSACEEIASLAPLLRSALLATADPGAAADLLQLDIAMASCGGGDYRDDYRAIADKDLLKAVREALADPARQATLGTEMMLFIHRLGLLRTAKAWGLLERWSDEAVSLSKDEPRLQMLRIYSLLLYAEALRGQKRIGETVKLILHWLDETPDDFEDVAEHLVAILLLAGAEQCACELPSCDPVVTVSAYQVAKLVNAVVARRWTGVVGGERSSAEQASLERSLAAKSNPPREELDRLAELQRQRASRPEAETPLPVEGIDDVIRTLPARVTVLVYTIADEDVVMWILRRGIVRMEHRPGAARRVRRSIRALQNELMDALNDRSPELVTELSRDLVDPIGVLVDGDVLVIAPGVSFAQLPFDVLQTRDGVPLGEKHPIVYVESLVAMDDSLGSNQPLGTPVVIGVNGDGLFAAEEEAKRVAAILGTKARLGSFNIDDSLADFRNASIIHIAAHARISPENPFNSSLSIGADRRLTAWQLFRHAAAADLVTLSACDTSMEARWDVGIPTHRGASSSLVSFAFSGGAKFALSSLWTASDWLTADLMTNFYSAVARGTDFVHALHDAKRAVSRGVRGIHPHYFANFTLTARNVAVVAAYLQAERTH